METRKDVDSNVVCDAIVHTVSDYSYISLISY